RCVSARLVADKRAAHRLVPHKSRLSRQGGRGYDKTMASHPIRVIGIDPGLRRTGWGLVEIDGNRLGFIACGSVETDERSALAERLLAIHDGLVRVVEE